MAAKEVAIKKRAQMDKATQVMLVAVGVASVALGCALVLSIYFIKWIGFNTKVIGEKDKIIKDFETIQHNVATLGKNIEALSSNEDLEVVARAREERCARFAEGDIEEGMVDMRTSIEISRICTALRVIPDTLPSVRNDEAVFASLNKLFLETRDEAGSPVEPDQISGGNTNVWGLQLEAGMNVTSVAILIENTAFTTKAVLDTIERSIRNYDMRAVTISWRSSDRDNPMRDRIELRGNALAYYADPVETSLKIKTIYADDSKAKGAAKK